jgi:hypothetical protein
MTHGIANELTLRNKPETRHKIVIAILGNYGYLAGWTYLLKIYKKRFQFASKSIICNDAFPLFCEGHLKRQRLRRVPPPVDDSSRLLQERSFRRPPELVGQRGEALPQQLPLRVAEQQPLVREKVSLHRLAEGSFPS